MKIKVFTPNREGKIEFTRHELEKLLDEVYHEGQKDCNCGKSWTWATPYCNNSLISNSTTNATVAAPDLSTATYAASNAVIDDFKADATVNNEEVKPYSITMKINEADVNKAAEVLKAMLDQKGALIPHKFEDVFSSLAKELNF